MIFVFHSNLSIILDMRKPFTILGVNIERTSRLRVLSKFWTFSRKTLMVEPKLILKVTFFTIFSLKFSENSGKPIFKNICAQLLLIFLSEPYISNSVVEAYLQPSRTSSMELFCENSKPLTIFTNRLYRRCSIRF